MKIQLSDHFTIGKLIRFSLPSIIMMIFTSIYGVVDGIFVSNFAGKESVELTEKQINQHTQIGYAFAFITLGFLFCGVCVAHSVIEEQNNKVFTRIILTKLTAKEYFISKFVVALIISVMQTFVLAVCLLFIPGLDIGMSIITFLVIIFPLGLIFSTLSLLLGVLLGQCTVRLSLAVHFIFVVKVV